MITSSTVALCLVWCAASCWESLCVGPFRDDSVVPVLTIRWNESRTVFKPNQSRFRPCFSTGKTTRPFDRRIPSFTHSRIPGSELIVVPGADHFNIISYDNLQRALSKSRPLPNTPVKKKCMALERPTKNPTKQTMLLAHNNPR